MIAFATSDGWIKAGGRALVPPDPRPRKVSRVIRYIAIGGPRSVVRVSRPRIERGPRWIAAELLAPVPAKVRVPKPVHMLRANTERFRVLCHGWATRNPERRTMDAAAVTCPRCLAVLERRRARAEDWTTIPGDPEQHPNRQPLVQGAGATEHGRGNQPEGNAPPPAHGGPGPIRAVRAITQQPPQPGVGASSGATDLSTNGADSGCAEQVATSAVPPVTNQPATPTRGGGQRAS